MDATDNATLNDKLGFLNRLCSGQSLLTCQYNLLVELQPLLPWDQVVLLDPELQILPLNESVPFTVPKESCSTGIWQWDRWDQSDRSVQIQGSQQFQSSQEQCSPLDRAWSDWCHTIAHHYQLSNGVLMVLDICLRDAQTNQYPFPLLILRRQGAFNETEMGTLRMIHDALQQIVDQALVLENLLGQSKDDLRTAPTASQAQKSDPADPISSLTDDREPCIKKCLLTLGLTPRQVEVMHLIIKGKELAAIAQELGCTESTVRKHVENLYRRLGVQTRTAAIAQVLETIGIV